MNDPTPLHGADGFASRFFGPAAGQGGPFAMLGIAHEVRDPAAIRAAAARRLAQIDRHPLRMTPEADELRLAVHTAAAQVADPVLHAELIRHWPPGSPDQVPVAWRAHLSEMSGQLLQSARMILGASGGWNPRARRRLAHLARLHRVSANELIHALRPRSVVHRSSDPDPIRIRELAGPASTGRWWLLIHAGLAGLLVLAGSMLAYELLHVPTSDATARSAQARSGGVEPSGQGPGGVAPGPRSNILHHTALEQELRNILRRTASDPVEAAERAARSIGVFLDRWTEAPTDARERIVGQIAAIMTGIAAEPQSLSALLDPLNSALESEDPARRAGAAAMVALFARSPGVPRAVREAFNADGLGSDAVGGFDVQAASALAQQLDRQPPGNLASWQRWSDALAVCQAASEAIRTQTRLRALEGLLGGGVIDDDEWPRVAMVLAEGLQWRAGDASRGWMIERILDPAVRSDRLAGLTEVLATQLSVPGLNASMVLPVNADDSARAALASAYRAAWAASRPTEHAAIRAELLDRIRLAISEQAPSATQADRLLDLAIASSAAAMFHAGDQPGAAEMLAMEQVEIRPSVAVAPRVLSLDDEWGARLIAADNQDVILTMLARAMQDRSGFSPLAAEGVLTVAQQGGSRPVRDQARALAVSSAWDLQILLAIDRAASRRPSGVVAEIVTAITGAALPNPRDPDFVDRVRTVLLPTIAERMAEQRPSPLAQLEELLAEIMARRGGLPTDTPLLRGILADSDRWARLNDLPLSDRLSTMAVESRRSARAQNAAARAQLVVVHHRALVEFVAGAAVARAEIPRSTADRLLERMAGEWSEASTVMEQLLVSHRYEAELWRSILEGAI